MTISIAHSDKMLSKERKKNCMLAAAGRDKEFLELVGCRQVRFLQTVSSENFLRRHYYTKRFFFHLPEWPTV